MLRCFLSFKHVYSCGNSDLLKHIIVAKSILEVFGFVNGGVVGWRRRLKREKLKFKIIE